MQTETKQDRTKICSLDLDQDIIDYLKQQFEVYEGSLGEKVRVAYSSHNTICYLLANYDIPSNIQEYEVFIEDMQRADLREYVKEEHTRTELESEDAYYLACNYPQNIFNPIPLGSKVFSETLTNAERTRPAIKVVFLSNEDYVTYTRVNRFHTYRGDNISASTYAHLPELHIKNVEGTHVKLCDNNHSKRSFQAYLSDIRYDVAFQTPWTYDENRQRIDDPNFLPLLQSKTGEIVSFIYITKHEIVIGLPQTTKKKDLLQSVFEEILFPCCSDYFPEVAESAWIKNPEYYLPNQANLQKQKEDLRIKYENDLADIDKKISENHQQYDYLHKLLTGTDDELVKATIQFLRWLGFTNIVDKDQNLDKKFNEEDIQIDLGDDEIDGVKLLVIEVKGIGGTSTDSQCSQIAKIVRRRGKERNAYDVHGLYIVNNEMHKAPLQRTIPPFDETKITDAENDERGLCYTWQLFNLYFNIEAGIITKEEARRAFFRKGLLDFYTTLRKIGVPHAYYRQHTVVSLNIENVEIKKCDYFYFCQNGRWNKVKINSIQDNGQSFDNVTTGDYGFGLEDRVPNNLPLYIKL